MNEGSGGARQGRLKAALRDNLKRRKTQARARAEPREDVRDADRQREDMGADAVEAARGGPAAGEDA